MPAGRGRPPDYRPEFVEQVGKLCKLGATDIEIADFFEVDVRTIHRWKHDHEDFCHAIKPAKNEADDRVERSLYHRAIGYSYDAVKIMAVAQGNGLGAEIQEVPYREHVPPDATSAIFWLKNRRSKDWRDHMDYAPPLAPSDISAPSREVAKAIMALLAEAVRPTIAGVVEDAETVDEPVERG